MTIRTLIGRAICAFRERTGRKPVHMMKRVMVPDTHRTVNGLSIVPARQCQRCGFTVPVKTRKRKQGAS